MTIHAIIIVVILFAGCLESSSSDIDTPRIEQILVQVIDDHYILPIGYIYKSSSSSSTTSIRNETDYRIYNPSMELLESGDLSEKRFGGNYKGTKMIGIHLRNEANGSIDSHLVWQDMNSDWKLSTGDVIRLLSARNDTWRNSTVEPGMIDSGWVFELVYRPTNEVMAKVELS